MRQEQLQRHERGIHAPRRTSEEHLPSRHGSLGRGHRSTRPRALPALDNSAGEVRLQLPGLK